MKRIILITCTGITLLFFCFLLAVYIWNGNTVKAHNSVKEYILLKSASILTTVLLGAGPGEPAFYSQLFSHLFVEFPADIAAVNRFQ